MSDLEAKCEFEARRITTYLADNEKKLREDVQFYSVMKDMIVESLIKACNSKLN